jgi:DNA-binding SARP family transcriptional activator
MLAAKFAAPYDSNPVFHWPALEHTADRLITLFVAPPGYLYAGSLAEALRRKGRSLFWLRLGREDRDPATLLLSLIEGVSKLLPNFGASTLAEMQRNPGPVAGWPRLYAHLAEELAGSLPESSVLVFEHTHLLSPSQPTLAIFGTQLLAGLPPSIPSVVLSHRALPSDIFPASTFVKDFNGLKMDTGAGLSFADSAKIGLPVPLVHRVLSLMDGRAVPLAGIASASQVLGLDFTQRLVTRCRSGDQLLERIVRAWLSATDADELHALSLTLDLNYIHPQIVEAVFGSTTMPRGPWLQPLNNDWYRIWCVWNATLRSVLKLEAFSNTQAMKRAAEFLLAHDAKVNAVNLLLEMKDFPYAARFIAEMAEGMLNLGQWVTLEQWMNLLPGQVLYDWPQLVYIQGELSAARGLRSAARRNFSTAARLFSERQDQDGASKSLLAEGTLAVWENQTDHARICALMANALAASAGLTWYQGLASWLLGCLAASSGQMDDALIYFGQAADFIKEPRLAGFFNQVETLAQRQRALRRQREFHQQAFKAASQSEQEAVSALVSLINTPLEDLPDLLDSLGWSKAPLMLKLASQPTGVQDLNSGEKPGLWQKMLALLGLNGEANAAQTSLVDNLRASSGTPLTDVDRAGVSMPISYLDPSSKAGPSAYARNERITPPRAPQLAEFQPPAVALPSKLPETNETGLRMSAYTLGNFRLSINDDNLLESPGGRGFAVLKFLLANHSQVVPREVLMNTLWRDAEPNSARNRLNVALHSLRSALRLLTLTPIILYGDGNYFFSADIQVWIDFEEFERHFQAGRQLESSGQLPGAIIEYEVAASLYQGDFLEEDLYEDWPVLTRERLRVAYLDVLDRLSQIYFSRDQYAACVALCQQILERDNCREDAHCRLMRCFTRQGQQHLALRQYQICVDALRQELDIGPEPATTHLAERIRRRERI